MFDCVYARPIKFLESFHTARLLVLIYVGASSAIFPARNSYQRLYACNKTILRNKQIVSDDSLASPVSASNKQVAENNQAIHETGSSTSLCPRDDELEWRDFPKIARWFVVLKIFTNLYFVYALIQFIALESFPNELTKVFNLKYPLRCILVGRYLLVDEKTSLFVASIAATLQLGWSLNSVVRLPPYRVGLLYFLLLSEADLRLFYSRLWPQIVAKKDCKQHEFDHRQWIKMSHEQARELTPRQLFLLETMCFKVSLPSAVYYVLRPNRTAESHRKLRQLVAHITYAMLMTMPLIASLLLTFFFLTRTSDRDYLRVYHECDPHLKHLSDSAQLSDWSITFTRHRLYVFCVDLSENLVIWLENGIIIFFGATVMFAINYDLRLYWKNIDEKIRRLAHDLRRKSISRVEGDAEEKKIRGQSYFLVEKEMMDFFNQMERANTGVSDGLTLGVVACLWVVGSVTYYTQIRSIRLPWPVMLLIFILNAAIFLVCCYYVTLHQFCTRSYSSFCSLVALRRAPDREGLVIMEMYALKKSCYTLFNQYSFEPTTVLAIYGYSFSCFCLVFDMFQVKHGVSSSPPPSNHNLDHHLSYCMNLTSDYFRHRVRCS